MEIQINSDSNIDCHVGLSDEFRDGIQDALRHFSNHITRVAVYLSDENSDEKRGHDDMRCVIEAHLVGRQPVAVTCHADTVDQAVAGSAHKLTRLIGGTVGRLHDQHIHGNEDSILQESTVGEE